MNFHYGRLTIINPHYFEIFWTNVWMALIHAEVHRRQAAHLEPPPQRLGFFDVAAMSCGWSTVIFQYFRKKQWAWVVFHNFAQESGGNLIWPSWIKTLRTFPTLTFVTFQRIRRSSLPSRTFHRKTISNFHRSDRYLRRDEVPKWRLTHGVRESINDPFAN